MGASVSVEPVSSLFEKPTALPPRRRHDHHIPLKDESQIVRIRPYRYPIAQKNETKKMVEEMK